MLYLIQQIWIWIVVAALIGFLFGWLLRWRVTLERVDRLEDNLMLVRAARDRLEQDNKRLTVRLAAVEGAGTAMAMKPAAAAPQSAIDSIGGGVKPPTVTAPRPGGADDLKRITGIERNTEELLQQLGIYHYDQIAAWTRANIDWVDTFLEGKGLEGKGRITREGWVEQAGRLALGEKTDFGRMQDEAKIPSASSRAGAR